MVTTLTLSTTLISQRSRQGYFVRGRREKTNSPSRSTGILRSCSHAFPINWIPMLCWPEETCWKMTVQMRETFPFEPNHLSHSFPIVKPPVNGFIVWDFDSSNVGCIQAAINVGPYENWRACSIPDAIGGIGSSGFRKDLLAFLSPHIQCCNGKFHKRCTDVKVKAFSCGKSDIRAPRHIAFCDLRLLDSVLQAKKVKTYRNCKCPRVNYCIMRLAGVRNGVTCPHRVPSENS
jgi:hypothetical protein